MKNLNFILKKLFTIVAIMFIVSFIVFYLLRLSGVDPVTVLIGNKQTTEELKESLTKQYGLDKPLSAQYINWLKELIKGHLGVDYVNKQDIGMLIAARLPVTAGLVVMSSVIGTAIAIILGVIAAVNRNKAADKVVSVLMLLLSSAPSFVVSILVIITFARFFPGYSFIGNYSNFGEYIKRISIPSIIMSLHLVAMLGRVTRSSMISQLQAPYITTAKAKGLSNFDVIFKHGFHNAVIPVLTVAGLMFAGSVGGTVLIEQIFSLPGIGGLLVEGIQQNNYPVVQVLVLVMLVVYLTMSFLVDILYAVIDPRIKKK